MLTHEIKRVRRGDGRLVVAFVERRFSMIATAVHDVVGVDITVGLAQLAAVDTLDALTGRADAALLDAKRLRGF